MSNMKHFFIIVIFSLFVSANAFSENVKTKHNSNNNNTKSLTAAGCVPGSGSTFLELNNVRALIHTSGDMWWDLQGKASYEVPKGSGKTALFAGSIWIGGVDVNNQLKLSALKFRSNGMDYWPGPLKTEAAGPDQATTTAEICDMYDKHFIISRPEVAMFRAWYNSDNKEVEYPGYSVPKFIEDYPAYGPGEGYDLYLAPFYDNNFDGEYRVEDGDYPFFDLDNSLPCGTSRELRVPRLYGDQTLWWVYNDKGNLHTETGGDAVGMEIRAQAFAFSTNDELNNMTFYNYQLLNRSTYVLYETYFGVWTDADLGYAKDDYVGCDVNRGLGYLYNATNIDGDGQPEAYGGPNPPPPAIGIDFFEGPYQDPDNIDNATSWDNDGVLNCQNGYAVDSIGSDNYSAVEGGDIENGNINGLNFGDGIVDNERWGMRRFIFYNNAAGAQGEPEVASDYYNYLKGYWTDQTKLLYGGTGHSSSAPAGAPVTDFMFPSDTDPCGWGQGGTIMPKWDEFNANSGAANPADDRRLIQSAGPFTLEPGAVNDITTGAVWARASSGSAFKSVIEVKKADDKAQMLFENCFKVVDGPDAPELLITELDQELIFQIYNPETSNNVNESYYEKDPFINCGLDADGNKIDCDKFFSFQGYLVYQVKDETVSVTDLQDINLSRLAFQCDVKDSVTQIVNYTWDEELGANIPREEVNGKNEGIKHSFRLTEDLFANGNAKLINHKSYYFIATAYAYNDYKHYDQNDANTIASSQKTPFKAGRKSSTGSIHAFSAIPHKNASEGQGLVINSNYGDGLAITQTEGLGNGLNYLKLTRETENIIMAGSPWKSITRKYEAGYGPISVKVVDPLNISLDDYTIKFDEVSTLYNNETSWNYGIINDSKWFVANSKGDTVRSNNFISFDNEQVVSQFGIAVVIQNTNLPLAVGYDSKVENQNNGFLGAFSDFDATNSWLGFISDNDLSGPQNWIRAGKFDDPENTDNNDYPIGGSNGDPEEVYENVLAGNWGPAVLVSDQKENGLILNKSFVPRSMNKNVLANVDVVFTSDKSKWTRSCVIEMCEDNVLSEGNTDKCDLRSGASVDKNGNTDTDEATDGGLHPTGMGWFPGYAINLETGERLNIAFAEDSWLAGENGRDMIWNPSGNWYSPFGQPLFGGKHYIYIMGHTIYDGTREMPAYDSCAAIYEKLQGNLSSKKKAWKTAQWVSIPVALENNFLASDVRIELRVGKPYRKAIKSMALDNPLNDNWPMFKFSTEGFNTEIKDNETAVSALDIIRVVPNPYYGHSTYEFTQTDNKVKIINLPEKCTITIFNVNGTKMRQWQKDNSLTYIEWDLTNMYHIPISSGVYIVHIQADGIGDKIIKWFGALRPVDLNAF